MPLSNKKSLSMARTGTRVGQKAALYLKDVKVNLLKFKILVVFSKMFLCQEEWVSILSTVP